MFELSDVGAGTYYVSEDRYALDGPQGIRGKAVVLHAGTDDLGKGGNEGLETSLKFHILKLFAVLNHCTSITCALYDGLNPGNNSNTSLITEITLFVISLRRFAYLITLCTPQRV